MLQDSKSRGKTKGQECRNVGQQVSHLTKFCSGCEISQTCENSHPSAKLFL